MATTENIVLGNGGDTYSFSFPYLKIEDVQVELQEYDTVNNIIVSNLKVSNFTIPSGNPTTIIFDAIGADTVYQTAPDGDVRVTSTNGYQVRIRIFRSTNIDATPSTFFAGSAIRAQDLNTNFEQILNRLQEGDFSTNVDMNNNLIRNLATPTVGGDAANKSYVDTLDDLQKDYIDARLGDLEIPGFTRWRKVATAGQTVFSGAGDYGGTLSYSAIREQVFLNGAQLQRDVDYTANTGTSITLTTGAVVGDIVEVICVNNLNSSTSNQSQDLFFVQSGTGATTRTVESKLRDIVSVKDFGAVGDGVADDTAAIQAAIDAASGGCSTVYIPDGVYRLTAGLTIPDDGITIYGDGFGRSLSVSENIGTRLLVDFSTGWVITCNQACFTLKDIEIYGSDTGRWASAGSVDGTKGAIYLRGGVTSLLERVLIYQEPGIGVYLSHECPNSKLTQVTVEYCKGHAYYVDDGALDSSSGYIPCGIITFDSCRAARVNCCALFAGDPNNESGTGLSAYRLLLLNCEFFFCGGNVSLSSHADYVIKLYADNCSFNTCAISSPNGQAGGNSTTAGTLIDGVTVASLVQGIFIQGRNNTFTNTRIIRCYAPAITLSSTASSTTINGIEARHTGGINYNPAINIISGSDGFQISGVNDPQVADPSNIALSKVSASSQPVFYQATDGTYIFCGGDGLYLDPVGGSLSYYDGTIQQHRLGVDGTFRSLGAVRPITNNVASLGIAGARWTEVFAVNGTINTSDERLKEQIRDLSDAERRVAIKIKGLVKAFKFKHAVVAKGADARIHIGVIVQEVITAFNSEGLNPFDYGIVCHDTWEQELADDGSVAIEAGDVYSIRYEELLAFIITAL